MMLITIIIIIINYNNNNNIDILQLLCVSGCVHIMRIIH